MAVAVLLRQTVVIVCHDSAVLLLPVFLRLRDVHSRKCKVNSRKLSWAVFLAANISDTPGMECSYYGPGVNLQKTLLSDKLSLGLGCAYNYGRTNGTSTLSMFNSSLSGSYALTGKESKSGAHSVSFSVGLTNQIDTGQDNGGYEFLSTLNYAVSF